MIRSIKDIKNIKNKTVLVRADFNVPIVGGKVDDDFRIQKAFPTISYLQKKGAKVILISHLGKGGETLKPVADQLGKYIKVKFIPAITGPEVTNAIQSMKAGDAILLENLRNDKGEQSGGKLLALELSKLADMYVNEAFSVSHREDASIVLLPKLLPAYAGLQMDAEIKNLSKVLKNKAKPFLVILGGAKFETKMPLIKKYLPKADHVFIGGALLNDILEIKGYEVGKSLIDEKNFGVEKLIKNKKLVIPGDLIVQNGNIFVHKNADEVSKKETIIDIGPDSVKKLEPLIKNAKLILWNGPMGKYETEPDKYDATKAILKLIAKSKAFSVIGGGDTVDLISRMKMEKDFNFVSTGGGAMLEFLAKGDLPGIKALNS